MAEQYQSRYWPQAFSGRDFSGDGVLWAWYLIIVDGEEVGTIWLEKENPNAKKVVLGIMLGREDKFGKGIGREAIRMALEQAQKQLGYQSVELHVRQENARAIACYQRCGFLIVRERVKVAKTGRKIPYYVMKLDLN